MKAKKYYLSKFWVFSKRGSKREDQSNRGLTQKPRMSQSNSTPKSRCMILVLVLVIESSFTHSNTGY